jgi:signal transduction histidine kinase
MNPEPEQPPGSTVLIVDDHASARDTLEALLSAQPHRLAFAASGQEALARLADGLAPDAILLDVMMPGLDGFEVCQRIKTDPRWQHIPVVLVTALDHREHLVRGLDAGADDFLSKPVHGPELCARLRTVIRLKQQFDGLQTSMRLRDNLTHMIVHDIGNSMAPILMALETLKSSIAPENTSGRSVLQTATRSASLLGDMIRQLLDISRLESGQMPLHKAAGNLVQAALTAMDAIRPMAKGQRMALVAPAPVPAVFDADLIRRVLVNLLGNALKFTPADGQITIALTRDEAGARVAVSDSGPGIPPEFRPRIFEKFAQAECKARRLGTGLGLAFCKLAVSAHGGRIGVLSPAVSPAAPTPIPPAPGPGSTFWFTLPTP